MWCIREKWGSDRTSGLGDLSCKVENDIHLIIDAVESAFELAMVCGGDADTSHDEGLEKGERRMVRVSVVSGSGRGDGWCYHQGVVSAIN